MILIVGLFAVMIPSALNKWTNDASPIRSIDTVDATIESVQWTKAAASIVVSLENGSSVLIDDDRPHLMGSRVKHRARDARQWLRLLPIRELNHGQGAAFPCLQTLRENRRGIIDVSMSSAPALWRRDPDCEARTRSCNLSV